jgi:TadE-like protein
MHVEQVQPRSKSVVRQLTRDRRGVVFVEFIICFIPMFVFFLGIVQLAFSYATKVVVQHAASKAVRTAIVSEPEPKRDCKDDSGSEDRGSDSQGFDSLQDPFSSEPSTDGSGKGQASTGSPLLTKVRAAAYLPLAAMGPPVAAYPVIDDVLGSIGGGLGQYTTRFAAAYFVYNRGHAAVTFRNEQGEVYEPEKLEAGPVTIHVSYLHYCMIPLVSRIMCNPLYDLAGLQREITAVVGTVQGLSEIDMQQTIDSKGANITKAVEDLQSAPARIQERIEYAKHVYSELLNAEYPGLLLAWIAPSSRFQMIESEATLPFQFASYVDKCQDTD